MEKKACIFDLDGTLLYTLDSMARPANRALRKLGFEELPVENFRYYCGDGAEELVRRILRDSGDTKLRFFEEARGLYREYFAEDPLYRVEPFPGINRLLDGLKEKGLRLAVCSNKPHDSAVKVIRDQFPGIFELVIGQSNEIRRKPAPDAPLKAASELNTDPTDCIYIGDSGTDMKTGKAAGMLTIGALWGYRSAQELTENGADLLIRDPEELMMILQKI